MRLEDLAACTKSVRSTARCWAAPLRFLLADDPGAGKTIMAGLYIKELLLARMCTDV